MPEEIKTGIYTATRSEEERQYLFSLRSRRDRPQADSDSSKDE